MKPIRGSHISHLFSCGSRPRTATRDLPSSSAGGQDDLSSQANSLKICTVVQVTPRCKHANLGLNEATGSNSFEYVSLGGPLMTPWS